MSCTYINVILVPETPTFVNRLLRDHRDQFEKDLGVACICVSPLKYSLIKINRRDGVVVEYCQICAVVVSDRLRRETDSFQCAMNIYSDGGLYLMQHTPPLTNLCHLEVVEEGNHCVFVEDSICSSDSFRTRGHQC